jgi:hypothetical protein
VEKEPEKKEGKKMIVTYEQLNHLGLVPAFRKLASNEKYEADRALIVAKLCEAIEAAIEEGRKKYTALLERHPIPKDESGTPAPSLLTEEMRTAFMADHKAMMSEEVEIPMSEVTLADTKGILFSPQEITALAPFIVELKKRV